MPIEPAVGVSSAEALLSRYDPDGVDDAGQIAEQCKQYIDPEVNTEPDLQKDAKRRQQDGDNYLDHIHAPIPADKRPLASPNADKPRAVPVRRSSIRHPPSGPTWKERQPASPRRHSSPRRHGSSIMLPRRRVVLRANDA